MTNNHLLEICTSTSFIKRYRKDYVTSPAVRDNLYTLFDEDKEFKRISSARTKVGELIQSITDAAEVDKSKGVDSNRISELKTELEAAKSQLEDSEADIAGVKAMLLLKCNDGASVILLVCRWCPTTV